MCVAVPQHSNLAGHVPPAPRWIHANEDHQVAQDTSEKELPGRRRRRMHWGREEDKEAEFREMWRDEEIESKGDSGGGDKEDRKNRERGSEEEVGKEKKMESDRKIEI